MEVLVDLAPEVEGDLLAEARQQIGADRSQGVARDLDPEQEQDQAGQGPGGRDLATVVPRQAVRTLSAPLPKRSCTSTPVISASHTSATSDRLPFGLTARSR
jgi:hypothetical protein